MTDPAVNLSAIRGRTVLIAENNPLVALDLVSTIDSWGALPILAQDFPGDAAMSFDDLSAAVIDVSDSGPDMSDLIATLQDKSVPILITTSWAAGTTRQKYSGIPVFEKPISFPALADWFASLDQATTV